MTELPLVRAPRIPVTDTFHGVAVTEDYRWLEDASSEEAIAWTKAQQHRSRTYFGGIPWRDALRARAGQLLRSDRTTYKRLLPGGSTIFALKVQTPRQQPFLVALTDLDDPGTERVVVDPDVIDPAALTPQVFGNRCGSASSATRLTALTSLAPSPTSGLRRTTCLPPPTAVG
jgi:prolyl oligopeptidase